MKLILFFVFTSDQQKQIEDSMGTFKDTVFDSYVSIGVLEVGEEKVVTKGEDLQLLITIKGIADVGGASYDTPGSQITLPKSLEGQLENSTKAVVIAVSTDLKLLSLEKW